MKDFKIFYNPRCSKCRDALCLLEGKPHEVVEYLENPPTERELLDVMNALIGDFREIVRVKEASYQENPFPLENRTLIARELAKRPELIERPIVVHKGKAVIGRPVERLKVLFE